MNTARRLTAESLTNTLRTISSRPSLDSLRAQLERAERDDVLADYIDNTDRRDAVRREARARAAALREQIQRLEESL